MADTYLGIKEVEDLFASLAETLVAAGATSEVRIMWPTAGAPAWPLSSNLIYVGAVEKDGTYNKQREVTYTYNDDGTVTASLGYTRILDVQWVIYGPDSYDLAQLIRENIFTQDNHDTLAQAGIYIVPAIEAPRRVPELFADQWWERVDLNMTFYELIIKQSTAPTFESAEVTLYASNGYSQTFTTAAED